LDCVRIRANVMNDFGTQFPFVPDNRTVRPFGLVCMSSVCWRFRKFRLKLSFILCGYSSIRPGIRSGIWPVRCSIIRSPAIWPGRGVTICYPYWWSSGSAVISPGGVSVRPVSAARLSFLSWLALWSVPWFRPLAGIVTARLADPGGVIGPYVVRLPVGSRRSLVRLTTGYT